MKRVFSLTLAAAVLAGCSANSGDEDPGIQQQQFLPPPSVTLSLSPETIDPGGSGMLTWTASNATSCEASGAWSGARPISNDVGVSTGAINASGTHTFSLTCTGSGGSDSAVQTMVVGQVPAPIMEVHLEPAHIREGEVAKLRWSVVHATSCTAVGGNGSDGWSGSLPTTNLEGLTLSGHDDGEYEYTAHCVGPGGTSTGTKLLRVSEAAPAAAPVVVLVSEDGQLMPGESTELEWTTSGATTCTGIGGAPSDDWSGSRPLQSNGDSTGALTAPGSYTYTLLCTGPGGSTSGQAVVVVNSTPQPVVVEMQAHPETIASGESAQLSWYTQHANSCVASGSWSGTRPTSASSVSTGSLSAPGTYSFTLTCQGPTGGGTDTAVVVVDPAPATVSTFTANPPTVSSGQSTSLIWTTTGANSCTASGGSGADGWTGAVPTSSTGFNVGPLPAGTHTYTLNCTGPGGPSGPQSLAVTVNATPPPAARIDNLVLAPNNIQSGGSSTIAWSTSHATACTASGGTGSDGWSGAKPTASAGEVLAAIATPGTHTYTLNCTGPGGASGPASSTLVVSPAASPAAVSLFNASPDNVLVGDSTSFSWSTTNATSCTASGGTGSDAWTGAVPTSSAGTPIGPLGNPGVYHYTLSCTGPGGSSGPSSTTVTVTVPTPPAAVSTLDLSPNNLTVGQSTSIAWTSTNATSCTASGGSGADAWTGAMPTSSAGLAIGPLNNPGTYTYTLQCSGPGGTGAASSGTLLVGAGTPPAGITTLSANPLNLQTGDSTSLSWTTSNANACTASGGTGSDGWSGSVNTSSAGTSVGPLNVAGSYQYRLACSGAGGSSGVSTVTVNVSAPPPPATITSLALSPNNIQAGDSTSLAWTTNGATSCTASGGSGADGWSGTVPTSSSGLAIGPIASAGSFTYTLTCSGPGGVSTPSDATLTVTATTPPAAITALVATPGTVTVGQSTSLSWSTNDATSCTASGGSSGDGWGGAVPASSAGTTVGPLSSAGLVTYTLQCAGPGGSSGPRSEVVTVNVLPPPAATIDSFQISPASITSGQSASLSWTTSNATSCTASNGTTGDSWAGARPTSSSGTTVGPVVQVGTQTYTLTCSSPGGSSAPANVNLTVNTPPVGPPSVSMTANHQNPLQVAPGETFVLRWSSTNATSCTALGGTGSDGWNGTQVTSGFGQTIGPINVPGIYTYTLNCVGPGGTGTGIVAVTVLAATSASCGIDRPSVALRSPAATVNTAVSGVLCLLCGVANPSRIIDSNATNSATIAVTAGVAATVSTWVTDTTTDYPAGRRAGFLISRPDSLLTLSALGNMQVRTYLNGAQQEVASAANLLRLSALGLFNDPNQAFVGFDTSLPFDTVRLDVGSLAGVLETVNVYGSCVTLD